MGTDTTNLTDAAVAVVQERAAAALADPDTRREYVEVYQVAAELRARGVVEDWHSNGDYGDREKARKSIEGKVRRALEKELEADQPRLMRFSSRDHQVLPRLDGTRRGLSGNAVGYTTPELYERAQAAASNAQIAHQARVDAMNQLLAQAAAAGFPEPTNSSYASVTYDADGLRALLAKLGGQA